MFDWKSVIDRNEKGIVKKQIVTAAIVMVCLLSAVLFTDASDAEPAPTAAPEIKFWVYENNDWVTYSGHGYYAGQAIANATKTGDIGLTFTWGTQMYYDSVLSGADFTYMYQSGGNTYTNVNPYYGKIATVNNSSDFTIYRYANGNWNPISSDSGLSVMGFYRPFDDYQLASANIAFVPSNVSPNTLPTTGLAHVYNVIPAQGNPDPAYEVTFHIGNNTYTGYGSDCALALKNALDSNNVPNTIDLRMVYLVQTGWDDELVWVNILNNSWYGFVTQIGNQSMGTGYSYVYDDYSDTTHVFAHYAYWSLHLGNDTTWSSESAFMLGFMSPLSYVPSTPSGVQSLEQDEFTFVFDEFDYDWYEDGDTREDPRP
ncbi:transmembrane protein [methanogenic archaeon ISO4-H5]|nr:transmembrane protein [methanogenic archaeon ISO4-H5]